MTTTNDLVARYLAAFNEPDAGRRRAALAELLTDDCRYTDPLGDVVGPEGLGAFIGGVREQFAGVVFSLAGAVDAHHEQARFTWHAGPPGAPEPLAVGFDVIELAGGRIRRVYGFLDKAPAAP